MGNRLLAFLLTLPLLACQAVSLAHAEPFKAQGVFCDDLAAAKDFLQTYKGGDLTEALHAVNERAKSPDNCGTAVLYVEQTESYDTVTTFNGVWQLVKLRVLAQVERQGPFLMIRPLREEHIAFSAVKVQALQGSSI